MLSAADIHYQQQRIAAGTTSNNTYQQWFTTRIVADVNYQQ
jgi:hypothetical protein